ncbi:unnamed protein product [Clonostachys rosea f. rosea IK726]|uniref:Uncharacterized protein n=1 Tax=Clonostachys rosea f. rosea IK726 TaxID=1349383 RepID=A0ACA9UJ48_BIOOC|nr:unnamed protein product [Clonostachys rosea f. rosea IK726]
MHAVERKVAAAALSLVTMSNNEKPNNQSDKESDQPAPPPPPPPPSPANGPSDTGPDSTKHETANGQNEHIDVSTLTPSDSPVGKTIFE